LYTRPFQAARPAGGIAIVGPCAAGKTTLARGLQEHGWPARQIAQEHSYVADMWKRLSRPNLLVFLDASFETCTARKRLNWTRGEYEEQLRRLAHARLNCDIYVDSDTLPPEAVLAEVLRQIQARGAGGGTRPSV
jgi:chloramphenicol 3-O-phosphotransferase